MTLSDETRNWWAKAVVHPDFKSGLNWLRESARPTGSIASPHDANILLGRLQEFDDFFRKLSKLGEIPAPAREEPPELHDTTQLGLGEEDPYHV